MLGDAIVSRGQMDVEVDFRAETAINVCIKQFRIEKFAFSKNIVAV